MKPSLFEYAAPTTIDEALQVLRDNPGAMVLAGGQSLLPAMNFRLAAPSFLVDLQRIGGLNTIEINENAVIVGAMVRHRDLEQDQRVHDVYPLIREVMAHVAHIPIRNRGTVVGSLCHGDAAAELPLLLTLTGGSVSIVGASGTRTVAAADFFQFHMATAREPEEIVVSARFPLPPKGAGCAFDEFARRHGDYAIASVGAIIEKAGDGTVRKAALCAGGIASRPVRLTDAEEVLTGSSIDEATLRRAGEAAKSYVTTPDDIHATTEYRKHLLATLVRRVTTTAAARAVV